MHMTKIRAYGRMIASMLIFGTIGLFRRWIPLPSGMLACVRGLLGALSLFLFTRLRGREFQRGIGRKTLLLLILSGGLMGFNWILLFEAYNYTTVAVATMCYYMAPTIVILLSSLLFHERLTPIKLICAFLALVGMVFLSGVAEGGGSGTSGFRGIACGLGAAALYASVVLLNKKIQLEDAYEKTILQLFSAAIILIPYVLLTEMPLNVSLDARAVGIILIVGLVHTGLAYALYFGSMGALRAQSIAVLSYIDPVFALFLSAAVLHEKMTPFGVLGAVLIIASALVSEAAGGRPSPSADE